MTTEDAPNDNRPPIPDNEIIERFGGIRPMAAKLDVAVTTVQGWKERGHIPAGRMRQIAEAAAAHGVDLGIGAAAAISEEAVAKTPEKQAVAPRPAAEEEKDMAPQPAEEVPAAAKPHAEADAVSPVATAAGPSRSGRPVPGVAWIAFALALVAGVAVLTRPYWEPAIYGTRLAVPGGIDRSAVDRVVADIDTIQESVSRMETEAGRRTAAMEERIAALEAGGGEAGAAFAGQLADIDAQMKALSRSFESLSGSANQVTQRLAALESAQERVSEPVQHELDKIAEQATRLQSALEKQGAELNAGLAALEKTTGALESRVTELETRPIQTGEKIAALALAIGQLEAAVDSGRPYRPALERLRTLGQDDPLISEAAALTALAPWADHGIPDRLALYRRFTEITPQIARALAATNEESWLDSVWNSLKGLITIRRVDGDGELSPVSQAEIAMDRGDLSAAAAALGGAGNLGPEGEAWLVLVNARITAEREIETLYGQVIAPLAGGAGVGASPQ